jgi:AcrR family transcriptional regulator
MKKSSRSKKRPSINLGAGTQARQTLIDAAKKLFARKGLSATTIRDIALEANLNSSLISYYFNGKTGLYKACLEEIGSERLKVANEILRTPASNAEFRLRLKMFIENLFALYLEDRDSGLIIVREYDRVDSPAEEIFRSTFLKVFDRIHQFFSDAQKRGLLDANKDAFIQAKLFFGCVSSQMRLDHINEKIYHRTLKDPVEKERVIQHTLDLFLPA